MSRVLLTGATGFVGRHALNALAEAGHEVHAVARRAGPERGGVTWHEVDLLESVDVVGEVRPEVLLHLAWYAAHGSFWTSLENVRWVESSLSLLRAFAACGGRRAVVAGTCAEYAWGGEHDLNERDSALRPSTLYGICKDALRRIVEAQARDSSFEVAWARLFFLYGPHEDPARLVPSVVRALLAGERAATTSGEQVRDFMHVHDVADALVALARSDVTGAVNIASGEPRSIAEIVEELGVLTGAPDLIDRGARPTSPGEPARIVADVDRLEREVGFRPASSLHEGLASTVDWWREQTPAAR